MTTPKKQKRRRKPYNLPMDPILKEHLTSIADKIHVTRCPATSLPTTTMPLTGLLTAAAEQYAIRYGDEEPDILNGPTMTLYGATSNGRTCEPLGEFAEEVYREEGGLEVVEEDILDAYFRSLEDGDEVELRGVRFSGGNALGFLDLSLVFRLERLSSAVRVRARGSVAESLEEGQVDELVVLTVAKGEAADLHPWDLRKVGKP